MRGLIIQCIIAICICLLGLILHSPWFDVLLQFIQNTEHWYLSEALQRRPGLLVYGSMGLVILFNFSFLVQLLKQFMLKEWDLSAIIRGFAIVFTGLTLALNLLVHLAIAEAKATQSQKRQTVMNQLDTGMPQTDVRNYLEPLFPETLYAPKGQQDLFSYKIDHDGTIQVYKVEVSYQKGLLTKAQYKQETFGEPFVCEVLHELPNQPKQNYPYPCPGK